MQLAGQHVIIQRQFYLTGETVGRWAGSSTFENQVDQAASNNVSARIARNVQTLFVMIVKFG